MPMMPPEQTVMPASRTLRMRGQAIVVGPGRDDRPVVLARGVEVVVVSVEPGLLQPPRLVLVQHAERDAGFEPHALHPAHHFEHAVEGVAVLHLAPGCPHAEARGACSRARRAAATTSSTLSSASRFDGRLVVRRLRAVPAVLGAAAGLDAEQRAELNLAVRMVRRVHAPRLVEQSEQRQVVKRPHLAQRVVVAQRRTRGTIGGHRALV